MNIPAILIKIDDIITLWVAGEVSAEEAFKYLEDTLNEEG